MDTHSIQDIEAKFRSLTPEEQGVLLQRLTKKSDDAKDCGLTAQLREMAADPDIQREIREIQEEFAVT